MNVFDVCVCRSLVVPPDSECVVLMRIIKYNGNKEAVFYPLKEKLSSFSLAAARSIVKCNGGFVPVRLCNLSNKNVVLQKNIKVGIIEFINEEKDCLQVVDAVSKKEKSDLLKLKDKIIDQNHLSLQEKQEAMELVDHFQNVFATNKSKIGYCDAVKHRIDLKNNAPVQQVVSKVPINVEDWVDQQVEKLKESGVLRESTSPWSAPIVVVKKKSGDLRMCIDYRRLNSVTIKPVYSIPDNQTLFSHLSEARMFSAIDISSAYYQCELEENAKRYTAFSTRRGHYEFNRMPFGLAGAPFTFQRLMHTVLKNENWLTCLIYLDDVLIFSKDFKEHVERLRIILSKIEKSGLKLSPLKCNFFMQEISYLGHLVTSEGLKPDPTKIETIKKWPQPKTIKDLRSFLGFANYYRKFISSYSLLSAILESLMKGHEKKSNLALCWTEKHQKAFVELKDHLCSAPCLAYPRKDCQFILDTDASHSAIGCVLSQIQDGNERVIAYGSRKLTETETKYCVTRKELLSVYYFVCHFKQFLLGRRFKIRTDHKALKWMLNWEKPNTTQYCTWIAELEIFDFEIEHRSGIKHLNAD